MKYKSQVLKSNPERSTNIFPKIVLKFLFYFFANAWKFENDHLLVRKIKPFQIYYPTQEII